MRIQKAEVPWADTCFELEHQLYNAWVQKILEIRGVSSKMMKVEVKKALDCSGLLSVTRHH